MDFNFLKKEIDKSNEKLENLSFEYKIEDLSFKSFFCRNYIVDNEYDLFSVEINIFDNSLDLTILNYGGNIVTHRYFEKISDDELLQIIKSTSHILNL